MINEAFSLNHYYENTDTNLFFDQEEQCNRRNNKRNGGESSVTAKHRVDGPAFIFPKECLGASGHYTGQSGSFSRL